MKFLPLLLALFFVTSNAVFSQNTTPPRPKLIVGIVVDQMRYDFLYRYESKYVAGGFKRLLSEGFSCENTHYNYAPTYTGPGHAAIYTGATPSVSGIIANEWWDPEWRKKRYVTADERYKTVGSPSDKGRHSPSVLLSTTVTDELRLSNNFQSKVVSVCLKDRGSILPAGHIPNAAYWFDDPTGNWITSTYYPDSVALPKWVQDFNARRLADSLLLKNWDKLLSGPYHESFSDWDKYSGGEYWKPFIGEKMPYELPNLKEKGYGLLRFTPFGSTLTLDFAMEAVNKMQLGADESPDVLCISFSGPDYCGHQFGIHAEETEDTYLRLDRDIARFLEFLDKKFGKNNVLVFLTADHGGAETPAHLKDLRIPAGVFPESKLEGELEKSLAAALGTSGNFIHEVANQQIWLNWDAMLDLDVEPNDAASVIIDYLRHQPGVYDAFTREELEMLPAEYPFAPELRRGVHPRRSGDIMFQLDPAWHADDVTFAKGGTTHGSPYAYDTHVPLLWYGWKIKPGETFAPVSITDIAPTLAAMLRIMEPNGNQGKVIQEVVEGN